MNDATRVRASQRNTAVTLVIQGHRYRLIATGEWWDLWKNTDARGYGGFWYMKRFERLRRLPHADWFALAGFILPAALPDRGLPEPSGTTCFDLSAYVGGRPDWIAPATGVLHVFPNDLPCLYWNNWGSITLQLCVVDSHTATPPTPEAAAPYAPETP